MAKQIMTNEEEAGKKIEDILSDSRLDFELVGFYFGKFAYFDNIQKLKTMADKAVESREEFLDSINQNVQPRTAQKLAGKDSLPQKQTKLKIKADILGDVWLNKRNEDEYQDFIEYNDLGLPLAYAYSNGMLETINPKVESFIEESFESLLVLHEIEDKCFTSIEDFEDSL